MEADNVDELVSFLQDSVGSNLRSVTVYKRGTDQHEIVYGRDDVLAEYSPETLEQLVSSYRWESSAKFVEENRYNHGNLNCIVRCFDEGIELNLVSDGQGVAIGLESGTFLTHNTFIGKCMELADIE